jgi:hypothetical protein
MEPLPSLSGGEICYLLNGGPGFHSYFDYTHGSVGLMVHGEDLEDSRTRFGVFYSEINGGDIPRQRTIDGSAQIESAGGHTLRSYIVFYNQTGRGRRSIRITIGHRKLHVSIDLRATKSDLTAAEDAEFIELGKRIYSNVSKNLVSRFDRFGKESCFKLETFK